MYVRQNLTFTFSATVKITVPVVPDSLIPDSRSPQVRKHRGHRNV